MRELYGKVSSSKYANIALDPGDHPPDRPGKEGCGDPHSRDRSVIFEDIRKGYVSPSAAKTIIAQNGYAYKGRAVDVKRAAKTIIAQNGYEPAT